MSGRIHLATGIGLSAIIYVYIQFMSKIIFSTKILQIDMGIYNYTYVAKLYTYVEMHKIGSRLYQQ